MKTITKHFATLNQADRHQNRLYNKYSHVRLTGFPRFSEDGMYVWEVKKKTKPVLKPSQVMRLVKKGKIPSSIKGGTTYCKKCGETHINDTESPTYHENGHYISCGNCKATTLYQAVFPACEAYPDGFEIDLTGERKKYPLLFPGVDPFKKAHSTPE